MGLEFLGNVANAYGGFQKGQEQELARQQLEKDRAYQQGQREYQGGQQQRTLREQGLADQLRTADMEVGDEHEVPAPGLGVQLGAGTAAPGVGLGSVAPPGVGAADTPAGLAASLPPVKVRRSAAEMATEYARNRRKLGMTAEAMQMDANAQSFGLADDNNKRAQVKFTREEAEYGRKMDEEGTFRGARAMDRGDVAGAVEALNAGGKYKVKDMVLTPKKSTTPNGGTELSYDATYKIIHPDGRVTEETRNSRELLKQLMPFEKAWEMQIKESDSTTKVQKVIGDINTATERNRLQAEVNLAKAEAAAAKASGANLAKASQIASFDTMLGTLERLGKHPGLSRSVGVVGAFPTMPGSNSANFKAELNTFQSQAFVPMVAQLKGMGALSDAEGKKLTQAVGALDPSMGETAFRESVSRITMDMSKARERMLGIAANTDGAKDPLQPPAPSNTPMPMPKTIADMKPGSIYQTGRGPAKWNGTVFEVQ